MSKINWFPGHMAKGLKGLQEEIKNVIILLKLVTSSACIKPQP